MASVNGKPIYRLAVIDFYGQLPPQMAQIPLEQILPGIINELAARKLLGEAAEKAKLGRQPRRKGSVAGGARAVAAAGLSGSPG